MPLSAGPDAGRLTVLPATAWRCLEAAHADRVDALTSGHRARAARGLAHPVEDFLFSYYSLRPAQLRRWHPGIGIALADAAQRAGWPFHRRLADGASDTAWPDTEPAGRTATVTIDVPAFRQARGTQIAFTSRLLAATSAAPGQFGCFGLHEWAMVFGHDGTQRRHLRWPLRLGQRGTDEVVRDHSIRCSHFDAFRFFTPQARPLNLLQPDAGSRVEFEQPGCLHASMDVYKWAYKLVPVVPSELLVDCFGLAMAIRELDMRASPYDLSELGYQPVRIETPAGKAEYVAAQRSFAESAQALRHRLLAVLNALKALAAPEISTV